VLVHAAIANETQQEAQRVCFANRCLYALGVPDVNIHEP